MKHDLEKNYFEYLAKLVLEATMPDTYQNIQLQDKPDLLTGNNEGIEVTRLFFKNAGESAGFFNKIKEKNISELDPKSVDCFEKLGNKLICHKGIVAAYMPEAVWVYPELLQRAYREKLLKLQHYKPETNCQGLFNQIHKKGARSTIWLLTPRLTAYIFPFSRSLQRYA